MFLPFWGNVPIVGGDPDTQPLHDAAFSGAFCNAIELGRCCWHASLLLTNWTTGVAIRGSRGSVSRSHNSIVIVVLFFCYMMSAFQSVSLGEI